MADAFIISYPKSGRTWLNLIVNSMMELDKQFSFICFTHDIFNDHVQDAIRYYQVSEYFWRKEITIQRNKEYGQSPIFLLTRDPRDALVSYYHQKKYREPSLARKGIIKKCVEIDISIDDFVCSEIWGIRTMINFYNEWAKTGIETIAYEDMVKNTYRAVKKLLKQAAIKFNKSTLKKVVDLTRFDRLKEIEIKRVGKENKVDLAALKMRRGIIGSHKDELKRETVDKLNNIILSELNPKYGRYYYA
jgi:hypothetical protein